MVSSPLSQDQRVLILYGTKYGQTEKIANRIATVLRECDYIVDLVRVSRTLDAIQLDNYGAVIVGSSVFGGKHLEPVRRWVAAHKAFLESLPSAFFSVSGAAAGSTPEEKKEAADQLSNFFKQTGWFPALHRGLAGAYPLTRYNWLIRFITVRVLRKQGKQVDPRQDIEMTDWKEVDRFASEFVHLTAERAARRLTRIA